ncbi:MAG: hypothetical protein FWF73_04340 [Spirochaetes bacterium]|nr:hypothetical protein [Spirochaetota bacterium]
MENISFGGEINCIAYGNGRFVAGVSNGKIAYSVDNGVTWNSKRISLKN